MFDILIIVGVLIAIISGWILFSVLMGKWVMKKRKQNGYVYDPKEHNSFNL